MISTDSETVGPWLWCPSRLMDLRFGDKSPNGHDHRGNAARKRIDIPTFGRTTLASSSQSMLTDASLTACSYVRIRCGI